MVFAKMTILDYALGKDQLDLRDFEFATQAEALSHAKMRNGNTVFELGQARLVLEDIQKQALDSDDFLF